jgi:RpiR family carbohydrate utilization transcriptional regulator
MLMEMMQESSAFGPAELRLVAFILKAPDLITQIPLATLAERAAVSGPTIIRLCRKLGCSGFPDFKIRLAQELASEKPYVHGTIDFSDSIQGIVAKLFGSTISNLIAIRGALDLGAVERAVTALAAAERIHFFAIGTSSTTAADAQKKFMFLEAPAIYHADAQLQLMSAAVLGPADAAVCLSATGQMSHVVRCAEAASAGGATVIGITRGGTALSRACTIAIPVDTIENVYLYSQVAARLVHLVVADVLATGVALQRGPGVAERVRRMKDAIRDERVPER